MADKCQGPGSPMDWLRHAQSDLHLASIPPPENVLLEGLCFHAQQAAEKAIKAVLIHYRIEFPRTHNIGTLLDLLPESLSLPQELEETTILTDYAVITRYPGDIEAVEIEEYQQAIFLAQTIVSWAEKELFKS